ncbi:hypothetical protein [Clostridium baratii]|uniref:hypothetical protein n=1 Tax=Clostridium baratii TaxID=1561 RepID=UPI000B2B4C84|nr:hypothetical protein [Clostridium baratii]
MSKSLYKIKWSGKNVLKSECTSYVIASSWSNAEKKLKEVLEASDVEVKKIYCEDTRHVFIAD